MTTPGTTAATPEHDAIARVVQLYIDAFNEHDVGKFKEAFHENAWIFFTDADGVLFKALIRDCFEEWATYTGPKVVGRIISMIQAGEVAVVVLGFDNAGGRSSSWVDIHSLLRIDGVWRIMNKTATHNSRAGWAGAAYSGRPSDSPPSATVRSG